LKQLVQIAILKSALNNDETAINKRLEFGFPGWRDCDSKILLETARTLLTKCSGWIQEILITTTQEGKKLLKKQKSYLNMACGILIRFVKAIETKREVTLN